jgi:hypothetical protein
MRRLLQELALFDRLSRQPTFWHDRALADESARSAAAGRELAAAFDSAEKRAEAAEDLAYEAYYARQVAAAETLAQELGLIEGELGGLGERLFASLFPPRNTVALILTTARSGWPHLCALATAVERWIARRGGTLTWYLPREVEVGGEPKLPATAKPKPKKKADKRVIWKWQARRPLESEPLPAAAVRISSPNAHALLAAEHGAHRFTAGGSTTLVKVRFEPQPPSKYHEEDVDELEKAQPSDEIRRVWPDKGIVHDLRMNRRFEMDNAGLDLEALLAAYQRWRVLESSGEQS